MICNSTERIAVDLSLKESLIRSWIDPYIPKVNLRFLSREDLEKDYRAFGTCNFGVDPIEIVFHKIITNYDFCSIISGSEVQTQFPYLPDCADYIQNETVSESYIKRLRSSDDLDQHLKFLVLHEVAHCVLRLGNFDNEGNSLPGVEFKCDLWALQQMYQSTNDHT